MKKKLCLLLVLVLSIATLTACGKDTDAKIESVDTTTPTESTESTKTEEITEPSEEATEPSENEKEDVEEDLVPGEVVDITHNGKPAASGEFGTSAEFTGIYEITSYSYISFGDVEQFPISLKGVNNDNSGDLDGTKTTISHYIASMNDFVYIYLEFDENGVADWYVIDRVTLAQLGKPTEKQLDRYIFPEFSYEEVYVGLIPDEIKLSNYELGKTYVFDLKMDENKNYSLPEIINDTEYSVIEVSTKVSKNSEFRREVVVNNIIKTPSISISAGTGGSGKLYLAITERSVDYLLRTAECKMLSDCEVGKKIDFNFEDFIYNDTDKNITISYKGEKYIIKPNEVYECSWMNNIMVENIE